METKKTKYQLDDFIHPYASSNLWIADLSDKRYEQLKEMLADFAHVETTPLIERIKQLEEENEKMNKMCLYLRDRTDKLKSQLTTKDKDIEELKKENKELMDLSMTPRLVVAKYKAKNRKLQSLLSESEAKVKRLEEEIEGWKKEVQDLNKEIKGR